MDEQAIQRARDRLEQAEGERLGPADVAAVLERARVQLEELSAAAAGLEATLPAQVAAVVRDGVRREAAPVGRQLAEVRGLAVQTIRRLERLEESLSAERHARVDDLGLVVDLITSGWRGVDDRLERIERALGAGGGTVHRLENRAAQA